MKIRDDWKERLTAAVEQAGGNKKGLSLAAGLNETFLRDVFKRGTRPSLENAEKISVPLKLGIGEWFIEQEPSLAQPNAVIVGDVEIPAREEMPRDVPVQGIAVGGLDGRFAFEGGVIDYLRRPPRLRGITTAYGIYVSGDSMSPWRRNGEPVYVHPGQPVKITDRVVVQCGERGIVSEAYVKELVRRTATELRLKQYNPADELVIPMKRVIHIHRVLDWPELLGI